MKNLKVIEIGAEFLKFEGDITMSSVHEQDCCEYHYLWFRDLTLEDFEGLEFDLSGDNFFERIDGYGIALLPVNGHPVRVPGYGRNNGYYSTYLELEVRGPDTYKVYDITECQEISD